MSHSRSGATSPVSRRRSAVAGILLAGAALTVLAGCGSSDSAAPAAAPPAASSAPAGAPAGQGQTVKVDMTEFKLALPTTHFAPGTYTFDAVNDGKIMHAISLDGPGVEDQKTANLGPGASAPLTVTLAPGTYDLYCPVGNHKAKGMDVQLTVG